ncbi:MAG: hypothetical protein ACJA2F_000399, partial [Nitriliruptoraceae bacterium]
MRWPVGSPQRCCADYVCRTPAGSLTEHAVHGATSHLEDDVDTMQTWIVIG